MQKKAYIAGATSSLGIALIHQLASQGWGLVLGGRDAAELEVLANDLRIRFNIQVSTSLYDLYNIEKFIFSFEEHINECTAFFLLIGAMGEEDKDELNTITQVIHITFTACAMLLSVVAKTFEKRKNGTIVVVSSVAGDRGRQSNYIYGSAKAGLSAFAAGLRNRLWHANVHVLTVKPGFVDTPLTYGLRSPLIASRQAVAASILKAMEKRKNCLYVPFFWRYIMLIIIHIPEAIFKRLRL